MYVKEQMGHSSIQVTVDLYGHLIPGGNKQAVDRLDQRPEKTVSAESATQPQPGADEEESRLTECLNKLEPASGLEPPTCGLRNRCSAN